MRVAIIGGGVSGLACARALASENEVVVFDKGRGFGGRLSTRRVQTSSGNDLALNHGAPKIETGVAGAFHEMITGAVQCDAARWLGDSTAAGTPTMNALVAWMGRGLDPRFGVRVARLERDAQGERLWDDAGTDLGTFDRVVVTAPAQQASELVKDRAPELIPSLERIAYAPAWVSLVTLPPSSAPADGPFECDGDVLSTITGSGRAWVLRATAGWSAAHLEDAHERVADALGRAAERAAPLFATAQDARAHRWRYARVVSCISEPCVASDDRGVWVCGDGFGGSDARGAWESGTYTGRAIRA